MLGPSSGFGEHGENVAQGLLGLGLHSFEQRYGRLSWRASAIQEFPVQLVELLAVFEPHVEDGSAAARVARIEAADECSIVGREERR